MTTLLRITILAAVVCCGSFTLGCASGSSTDYYQRGPTQHWDSFPGYSRHGPGYYRYGRPGGRYRY